MTMPCEIIDALNQKPEDIMHKAITAVLSAGEVLRLAQSSGMNIATKRPADYVTEHDIATENALRRAFAEIFPDALFYGEEGDKPSEEGFIWFVDPIDGTTNFTRRLSQFAISVGLYHTKYGAVFGIVYSPRSRELWYAVRGSGAYKVTYRSDPSQQSLEPEQPAYRIQVSDRSEYRGSLLLYGTPYRKKLLDVIMPLAHKMALITDDLRRLGVCSLDLCSIAEGCAELYFELDLHIWDISAGALIVTEAGGLFLPQNIVQRRTQDINIIASNGRIPIDMVQEILDLDTSAYQ